MLPFILLGWGMPVVSVSIWALMMYLNDSNVLHLAGDREFVLGSCWLESHEENTRSFNWIIQIPIIMTLVINAYIFINVVSVVNVKLKAGQTPDYKQRLARSTLSLIPLLGIQYLVVLGEGKYFLKTKNNQALFLERLIFAKVM